MKHCHSEPGTNWTQSFPLIKAFIIKTEGSSGFPADLSFTRLVAAMFNECRRPPDRTQVGAAQNHWRVSLAICISSASTAADDSRWQQMILFIMSFFFFFSFPPFPLSRFKAPLGNHLRQQPWTVKKKERGRSPGTQQDSGWKSKNWSHWGTTRENKF